MRYAKRLDSPIDLPERVAPTESTQQGLCVRVEAGDIECGSKGFDAIESPWSPVIGRIGGKEIGYWNHEPMNAPSEPYLRKRSCGLAIFVKGTSSRRAQEHSTTASPSLAMMSLSAGLTMDLAMGLLTRIVKMEYRYTGRLTIRRDRGSVVRL